MAIRRNAIEKRNLHVLKQFAQAAISASSENSGVFPETIDEVRKAGDIAPDYALRNPTTEEAGFAPLYFTGLTETSDPSNILFACPFLNSKGKRAVVYVDVSTKSIPEEEYQKQVEKQEKENAS